MQEEHIRIDTMRPPSLDVLEPGTELDFPEQEAVEKLREGSFVSIVAPVKMVIRDGHILAVADDINVLAQPLGSLAIGQVALENTPSRQRLEALAHPQGTLEPRRMLGDVGEVHRAVGGQLVEDHLHPGGARTRVGDDENIVRTRYVLKIAQP